LLCKQGELPVDIGADEVHLWMVKCSEVSDVSLLQKYRTILSVDELTRQQRYVSEKSRHRELLTRVLVRTTLSRYEDVNVREWCFSVGEYGKPEIATSLPTDLRFNLSHAGDYIVVAVTRCRDIGVDVEYIHRKTNYMGIARRYFLAMEIADLSALSGESQRGRFYDYWTLKEAYLKGCGLGLMGVGTQFGFHLNQESSANMQVYGAMNGKPGDWHFWRKMLAKEYRLALAVRCGLETDINITLFESIPLSTSGNLMK